jgi:hypothetical protein
MWVSRLLVVVLVAAVSACGGSDSSPVSSGVRGVVLAGPQCPVESVESPCPDQPVPDVTVRISTPRGEAVAEARTDSRGRFSVSVPAGSYVVDVLLDSPGGPGSAAPVPVTVEASGFVEVTVPVDTGIR